MASKLNQEQRAAYDALIYSILHPEGKAFFIDGPGGTGKSFLYNCITKKIYSMGLTLSACASTGIAATLIDGITIHKLMGVPMVLDFDSVSILRANSKAAGIIRDSACIIWDEAPAGHRFILDLADRFLRDITRTDRPFGGKTFIAGGDWRQTLPVVPRGTNMEQIAACLRMSPLWPLFSANTFILTQNMRATNPLFADWLLDVGNGLTGPTINLKEQNIRIVTSAHALIQATFGSVLNPTTIHKIAHCAILSPTNKNTYIFNEEVLNMLEGPSSLRYSIDYPIVERANHPLVVPQEFLHTLTPPGMPQYRLHLKIGGIYMILRNMCVKAGLCNGTRFILRGIRGHVLICEKIFDDPSKPTFIFNLPRITTTPPEHYPFPFKRRQYPIRPAFAMTINKSQGGTFDMVGIDASCPVFTHGQAYVALSRVRDFDKISVLTPEGEVTMKNIVFPQVFDKEYIDSELRRRAQRPIIPDRMDCDLEYPADNANLHFDDDEMEAYLDQFDRQPEYNPDDGVPDQLCPDSYMYTYDEMAFEDDWIPHDEIL